MNTKRLLRWPVGTGVVVAALSVSLATVRAQDGQITGDCGRTPPSIAPGGGGDPCDYVHELIVECGTQNPKLRATVKTAGLPGGLLTLIADDDFWRKVRTNCRGSAVAVWQGPVAGIHEVCIDECGICETVVCGCLEDADCDDGEFCNGEETCDRDTGECVGGDEPCAGDEICDEERNTCLPEAYVRLTDGGYLNDVEIDAEHYGISVAPGEPIVGSIQVEIHNPMPPTSVAPLCVTVDWGDREVQPREAYHWIASDQGTAGSHTYTVAVNDVAPDTPGNYHLIIAFSGELNCNQVMSMTNWNAFPDAHAEWYDGNDIGFDWMQDQFDSAIANGRFWGEKLYAGGMGPAAWHPATVVRVRVEPEPDWMLRAIDGPAARYSHAMVYDPIRGVFVMFGGRLTGGETLGDTWEWDGAEWLFRSATGPAPRIEHTMVFDEARGVAVLFGGACVGGTCAYGDTWTWDGNRWTEVTPPAGPSARWGHAMAYDADRGEVVMYGGSVHYTTYADTWIWNGMGWLLRATGAPGPRAHHAMSYNPASGRIVMTGGNHWNPPPSAHFYTDTWEWDGNNWFDVTPPDIGPALRRSHVMAQYETVTGYHVILFGGGETPRLADTWGWGGTEWRQYFPVHEPSPREQAAMAYDRHRRVLVIFGGLDANVNAFGDTWEYGIHN